MCKANPDEFLEYNFSTNLYDGTKEFTLDKYCFGLTVKNRGTSLVIFNDEPLDPGESKTIGAHKETLLRARISISFDQSNGGTTNAAWITQAFYLYPKTYR